MNAVTKSARWDDRYFEHYARVNDLSEAGRRRLWYDYEHIFAPWLPSSCSSRILDIGCGAGLLLEWLRDSRGYTNLAGIDVDSGQIAFARGLGLQVEQIKEAAEWVAEHAGFDLIFLCDVLEHVPKPADQELLYAIAQSLASRGRLILRVPNANASFGLRYRYIDATHFRAYTERSLAYELGISGFPHARILGDDVWEPRSMLGIGRLALKALFRFARRAEAVAEFGVAGLRMPLSLNLLAVCDKE